MRYSIFKKEWLSYPFKPKAINAQYVTLCPEYLFEIERVNKISSKEDKN